VSALNDDLEKLRRENAVLRARLDADPYRIIEPLGSGGFCTTMRAADRHEIEVCVKELKPHLREIPDCVRYFRREGRIGANLRHSNIVLLLDVDMERYRLVYQLIDGVDLRRLLTHAGGKLKAEFVILVGLGISSALDYAHTRTKQNAPAAVIHRDVTPANILIAQDGQVLLADFGVAAIESSLPQTTVGCGTAEYRSPEQVAGEPLDGRTDIFSLGVVLYELLEGRRPFDHGKADAASVERLCRGEYPPLKSRPGIPDALIALITRMLQPNRDDRPKDANEVFIALSAIAPSHDVVRVLGAMSRSVRKRRTKELCTLPLDVEQAELSPETLRMAEPSAASTAHDAVTAVRAVTAVNDTSTDTANPLARRVKPRAWAAALGATLVVLLAVVWPASRSRSAMVHEVTAPADPRSTVAAAPPSALANVAADYVPEFGSAAVRAPESPPSIEIESGNTAGVSPSPVAPNGPSQVPDRGAIRVFADKSALVRIDNLFVGWSPTEPKSVEPGSHTIAIGEGAQRKTSHIEVAAGETKKVFFKMRRPKD
jgi:eukaryotic-like serine/threonine-protein kinase